MARAWLVDVLLLSQSWLFFAPYTVFSWFLTPLLWACGLSVVEVSVNYAVFLLGFVAFAPCICLAAEAWGAPSTARCATHVGVVVASLASTAFCKLNEALPPRTRFAASLVATLGLALVYPTAYSMLSALALRIVEKESSRLTWGRIRAVMISGAVASALVVVAAAATGETRLSWTEPSHLTRDVAVRIAGMTSALAVVSCAACAALERSLPDSAGPGKKSVFTRGGEMLRKASSDLLAFYALLVLLGATTKAFDALLVVYLADVARASVPQLASVMLLEMSSAAFFSFAVDHCLVGRWNHRSLLGLAVLFVAVRVSVVALGTGFFPDANPLFVVLASQIPSGAWWALLQLVTSDFAYLEAPDGLGATAVAVANACCVGVGGILGALLGSATQTALGWPSVFNGALLLTLLAALLTLGLLRHVRVIPRDGRDDPETNPLVDAYKQTSLLQLATPERASLATPTTAPTKVVPIPG